MRGNLGLEDLLKRLSLNLEQIIWVAFSTPVKNPKGNLEQNLLPVPQGKICCKIKMHPLALSTNQEIVFFAEFFTEKQVFHKKIKGAELLELIKVLTATFFKTVTIKVQQNNNSFAEVFSVLANKKGRIQVLCKKEENSSVVKKNSSGQRIKQRLLPEGTPVPFLVHLGVMTPQGRVINSKQDKFRQVNRFLEFVDDILPEILTKIQPVSLERPVRIVDFGCGKSYLTFALHYFLTEKRHLPVEIIGLDLKDDVVAMCQKLAKELKCEGLFFCKGDIAKYNPERKQFLSPDLVITLHACDTATDYAMDYAVKHGCTAILSVPCCQHEANAQLNRSQCPPQLYPLIKHGLLKERFASLVTDAIRGEYLEKHGYEVQILEFIDVSHTSKNLLIRAVKKNGKEICNEPSKLSQFLGLNLTIENLKVT